MRLVAPRSILMAVAIALVVLALLIQWAFGFRFGETAGTVTEILALVLIGGGALVLLAPLGARRAASAAVVAFMLMLWAVYLNGRFSTGLDVQFGGEYAWSNTRIAVIMLFVAPVVALITAVVVYVAARRELIRWRGKTYTT